MTVKCDGSVYHIDVDVDVVVVIGDKSSSEALNSFQLSYVDVRMWVPNSCCIFQLGPDKCLVTSFFDVLRTDRKISAEKSSRIMFEFAVVYVFMC